MDRKRQRKMKMMKHQNLNVSIDYFLFCLRRALNYGNTVTIKFKTLYVTLLTTVAYTLEMTKKFALLYHRRNNGATPVS